MHLQAEMTFQAGIFGLEFWPAFQAGIFGLFFTGQNSRPKFSGQNSNILIYFKHFRTHVPLQTNKIQLRNHKFIFLQCQMYIGFLPSKSISFFCLTSVLLDISAWNSGLQFQAEIFGLFFPGQNSRPKFRPGDINSGLARNFGLQMYCPFELNLQLDS